MGELIVSIFDKKTHIALQWQSGRERERERCGVVGTFEYG